MENRVFGYMRTSGIDQNEIRQLLALKEFGVSEEDFYAKLDEMVELAFDDQCTGANPVYPIMSDMKQIYIDAFEGVVRDYYSSAKKSK